MHPPRLLFPSTLFQSALLSLRSLPICSSVVIRAYEVLGAVFA